MTKLAISPNGDLTLPETLVGRLGVRPGELVEVEISPSGQITVSAERGGKFSELAGMLKRPGQPVLTIEEMNEVIADSWAGNRD